MTKKVMEALNDFNVLVGPLLERVVDLPEVELEREHSKAEAKIGRLVVSPRLGSPIHRSRSGSPRRSGRSPGSPGGKKSASPGSPGGKKTKLVERQVSGSAKPDYDDLINVALSPML